VVPDCDARFEEDSEERILEEVTEHAATDHGITGLSATTREQIRNAITDRAT
jgi:predicted small metal-binding protein